MSNHLGGFVLCSCDESTICVYNVFKDSCPCISVYYVCVYIYIGRIRNVGQNRDSHFMNSRFMDYNIQGKGFGESLT